jgi:hypothetical protein
VRGVGKPAGEAVVKAPSHRGLYYIPIDCCHLCSVLLSDSLTLSTEAKHHEPTVEAEESDEASEGVEVPEGDWEKRHNR